MRNFFYLTANKFFDVEFLPGETGWSLVVFIEMALAGDVIGYGLILDLSDQIMEYAGKIKTNKKRES